MQQREAGQPLAHVLGQAEFCELALAIGPGVFVPRPRAECLVEVVVSLNPTTVLDLGCGCGALAAAVKQRLPDGEVQASDYDELACQWARRNGERYGFQVHRSNWLKSLPEAFDAIVAYLPHVPTAALACLDEDYLRAEGASSVAGGADGLDPLRAIFPDLRSPLVTLLSAEQLAGAKGVAQQFGYELEVAYADEEDRAVIFRPCGTRSILRSGPAAAQCAPPTAGSPPPASQTDPDAGPGGRRIAARHGTPRYE